MIHENHDLENKSMYYPRIWSDHLADVLTVVTHCKGQHDGNGRMRATGVGEDVSVQISKATQKKIHFN